MLAVIDGGKQREERELIAACLRGQPHAERELFRREYPRVHATVFRLLGHGRDVDDLVQETFVAAFRALPSFRGEAKLATWIDRIAVRIVFRHLRASGARHQPLELVDEPITSDGSVDDRAAAREGLRRLYEVLVSLSPDMRVAFALHAIDGRPIGEVARLVGASAIATKLRIWRARRELNRRAAQDPVLREVLGETRGDRGDADVDDGGSP